MTDVLVIAEDQGITDVHLARVGRLSNGVWSNANEWIGGDVPDLTQDVYIRNSGAVTLDGDAQARDLLVTIGNSIAVQNHRLSSNGTLTFTSAAVSVGAGGTIAANNLIGDPATLTTAAGSLVRFNNFTREMAHYNGQFQWQPRDRLQRRLNTFCHLRSLSQHANPHHYVERRRELDYRG